MSLRVFQGYSCCLMMIMMNDELFLWDGLTSGALVIVTRRGSLAEITIHSTNTTPLCHYIIA